MVLLFFFVSLSLHVILNMHYKNKKGKRFEWVHTWQPTLISPKAKHLGSHVVGWKYPFDMYTPQYGWVYHKW